MRNRSIFLTALLLGATASAIAVPARIAPRQARALLAEGSGVFLLDVRTREEFEEVRIPGAFLLPYDTIDAKSAAAIIPAKDSRMIVYCHSGRRSAIAAEALARLGYSKVLDLGGIVDWPFETERGSVPVGESP